MRTFAALGLLVCCCAALAADQTSVDEARPEAPINLTPGAGPALPGVIATLAEKDRQLFDAVFDCKPGVLATLVADDFEFYHDKHGQTSDSGAQFVKDITGMCARQQAGTDFKARRELVAGTMTVHMLDNYGAMQMGTHRFYALKPGKPDRLTETGKFIDLWKLDNGQWKLARVISYDHQLVQ